MALTTTDLQTSLAYRLGETAAPSDATTKALRLEWMNQGYMTIARRRNWWFLEASSTANTNTGSTTGYAEPTDLKQFIELKINDVFFDRVPYVQNRTYEGTGAIVSLPTLRQSYKYYRYGGRYYLIPVDDGDAAIHYIKYYKRVTKRVDGETFLIPDEYLEALIAFAEARYWMSITQQAKAVVPFQEFEEIVREMEKEHSRRTQGDSIQDPDDMPSI